MGGIYSHIAVIFFDKITIIRSIFPDDYELQNVHSSLDIIFLMNTLTLATETEIKKTACHRGMEFLV